MENDKSIDYKKDIAYYSIMVAITLIIIASLAFGFVELRETIFVIPITILFVIACVFECDCIAVVVDDIRGIKTENLFNKFTTNN